MSSACCSPAGGGRGLATGPPIPRAPLGAPRWSGGGGPRRSVAGPGGRGGAPGVGGTAGGGRPPAPASRGAPALRGAAPAGPRRCGEGPAGEVFDSNLAEGVRLALTLDPAAVVLEGSG